MFATILMFPLSGSILPLKSYKFFQYIMGESSTLRSSKGGEGYDIFVYDLRISQPTLGYK
jgi:hypothetical protein